MGENAGCTYTRSPSVIRAKKKPDVHRLFFSVLHPEFLNYAAILEAREALAEEKGAGPISQNVVVAIILGIRELLPLPEA